MILNQHDEVLVSQRIAPGTTFHHVWQFPGGHQEFGESFERKAQREVAEECGAEIPIEEFKFVTVVNVLFTEHGYHNVGIFMFCKVDKDSFTFENSEPDKCTNWEWIHWDSFMQKEPLFIPFKYFFEQGFGSLEKVKK